MKLFLLFSLLLFVTACGASEEEEERSIKEEGDVIDVVISQASPDTPYSDVADAVVGFDESDNESRLLMYFPKIENLYEDDVVISSITAIEVVASTNNVPVHPESIKLYAVTSPWSSFTTWNSRFNIIPNMDWTSTGGDYNPTLGTVTPAIREDPDALSFYELSFDVTSLVKQMITTEQANYGFILVVEKSDYSSENKIVFKTYNSESETRPTAVLVFTKKDTIQP